jgi:predicted nucleic acid-binding protein
MLVVDTNVVAHLLVEGERTAQARALWAMDPDWRAPRLLSYELANVFCQLVRQQAISLEEGVAGLAIGLRLVRAVDRNPAHARVLEIASSLTISAYDACYLATTEAMGSQLVTEDVRLLRLAPEIARSLESFGP